MQRQCNGRAILANEEISNEGRVEGLANDFTPLQGDMVQIAPYGQFPHPRGLQYFARADAEKLVSNFNSLKAKFLRRWGGLPWYEGHPDTSPKDYPNKKSFGWIDNVEARDDGLYAHVKWTKAGQEMVDEGHYKYFSPVWHATAANVGGKSVLRPDELISVGFTNTPNMPVLPLSNEERIEDEDDDDDENEQQENDNDMKLPNSILTDLGFAEDAKPTAEEITAAWAKHTETITANATTAAQGALANEQTALGTELENAKTSITNLGAQLSDTAKAFDAERHERIELLVATHIANGKITKANAEKWKTELKEDFAGKSVELANEKPALANEVLTKNLGAQQNSLEQGATPAQQAKALANEMVNREGIGFDVAWLRVKKTRPDLMNGMHQPKGANA